MEALPNPDRELDYRAWDGMEIRLMWVPGTDTTYVDIADSKLYQFFRVMVPSPDLAKDVFKHPFAYVAEAGNLAVGGEYVDT